MPRLATKMMQQMCEQNDLVAIENICTCKAANILLDFADKGGMKFFLALRLTQKVGHLKNYMLVNEEHLSPSLLKSHSPWRGHNYVS